MAASKLVIGTVAAVLLCWLCPASLKASPPAPGAAEAGLHRVLVGTWRGLPEPGRDGGPVHFSARNRREAGDYVFLADGTGLVYGRKKPGRGAGFDTTRFTWAVIKKSQLPGGLADTVVLHMAGFTVPYEFICDTRQRVLSLWNYTRYPVRMKKVSMSQP